MANQKTKTDITESRAALSAAEDRQAEAAQAVANAERVATELRQRNAAGDTTVTGLDLLAADANIEVARGLAVAATRDADRARQQLGTLIAQKVAADVASRYTPAKVATEMERLRRTITDALGSMVVLIRERDAVSDEAGRTLAAAGIPTGEQIGRVSYRPVTNDSGRPIPGKYNVRVDGESISSRQGHAATHTTIERQADAMLSVALRANGMHLSQDRIRLR